MKQVLLITKSIIRDREVRRRAMFSLVLVDLGLVAAGVSVFESSLAIRPVLFLIYWFACAWATFTVILLALYDLIAVRHEGRSERQALKRQLFQDVTPEDDENSPP